MSQKLPDHLDGISSNAMELLSTCLMCTEALKYGIKVDIVAMDDENTTMIFQAIKPRP